MTISMLSGMSKKKASVLLIILLAFILTPIFLFIAVRTFISFNANTVAEINGQKINKADLEKVAREQYAANSINDQVLKDTLDIAVERKILDKLEQENNIKISDAEITKQEALGSASTEDARYSVLKQKITLLMIKNWQVYIISFWIPPDVQKKVGDKIISKAPDDLTKAEANMRLKQIADAPKALSDAEQLLKTNSALSVAQALAPKYPNLSEILAVNGYSLSGYSPDDISNYDYISPRVYSDGELTQGFAFGNTIRSMNTPNEIKKILMDNNSGGGIIKLININSSAKYSSYEDLLNQEKKSLYIK